MNLEIISMILRLSEETAKIKEYASREWDCQVEGTEKVDVIYKPL